MTFRTLSKDEFKKVEVAESFGPAPMLEWLDLELLVVDDVYQRAISGKGAKNIACMIREFNWSKFSPVLVAPIEGGRYSIIDGQHRATAALACGVKSVPCQIVQADLKIQAEAFAAVNDRRTNMHPIMLYHANLVAGDPAALEIADVCNRAGVEIPSSPRSAFTIQPNQIQSPSSIGKLIRQFEPKVVITTLKALLETGHPLTANCIEALCMVLAAHQEWREAGGRLFEALDEICLDDLEDRAKSERKLIGNGTIFAIMSRMLEQEFAAFFGTEVAA